MHKWTQVNNTELFVAVWGLEMKNSFQLISKIKLPIAIYSCCRTGKVHKDTEIVKIASEIFFQCALFGLLTFLVLNHL